MDILSHEHFPHIILNGIFIPIYFYHFDFLHIDQLYVSGCWNDEFYLDSTEILQDGEWVQGKMNNTICYILEKFRSHNTLVAAWCSTQQSTH
jgi:hypothetical protein